MRTKLLIPAMMLLVVGLIRMTRVVSLLIDGSATERLSASLALVLPVALFVLAWRLPRIGFMERMLASRGSYIAFLILLMIAASAVMAPVLASYPPNLQIDLASAQHLGPSLTHPFGTDLFSRDLFSRVLYGARISLSVATLAVAASIILGSLVGMAAALIGGWTDTLLMRFVDSASSIPRLVLLLVILGLWGTVTVPALVLILGLTGWFDTSRLVRAEVLSIRKSSFVRATEVLGVGWFRTVWRHLLPNVAPPVIVAAALGVGNMILLEAGLSFLGLGTQPPTASWGSIIQDGRSALATAPWVSTIPGIAIVITVTSLAILGEGLQRALNPQEQ